MFHVTVYCYLGNVPDCTVLRYNHSLSTLWNIKCVKRITESKIEQNKLVILSITVTTALTSETEVARCAPTLEL